MKKISFMLDLDGTILFLGTDWERGRERLQVLYDERSLKVKARGIFKSMDEGESLCKNEEKAIELRKDAYAILEEEEVIGAPGSKIREGALELLEFLRQYKPAIVSNNSKDAIVKAFDHLGIDPGIFSVIIARDVNLPRKPDPAPILKAVRKLKEIDSETKEFFYIGDQKNDVISAKKAGDVLKEDGITIKTIAVCGGASREKQIREQNPDYFTTNLSDALKIAKGVRGGKPEIFNSVSASVIAYNEEETVKEAVLEVLNELKRLKFERIEILVIDDASTDGTAAIVDQLKEEYEEIRVIRHEKNMGPGSGMKTGFLNSKNEIVCFHAADRQLDFREVASHLRKLDYYDLLIAERTDRPGYTFARNFVSWVNIALIRTLFGLKYRDYNFLYLYRKSVFDGMKIETNGVFTMTEVLVRAVDKGCTVGEIKVGCKPRLHGKASCGKPSIILKTFFDLLKFWWTYKIIR